MAVRAPLEIPAEDGPERDRALIQAHVDGDPHAFQLLVLGHYSSMLGHAFRRLHDAQAAEDAVQDALVRAYRSLGQQHSDYRLGPWLHRIVDNVCTDEGRRRHRETEAAKRYQSNLVVLRPVEDDSPDLQHVTDAIALLPEGYRQALVMRDVMELEYADVAEHAGITEQNARARVSRARAALRKLVASTVTVWVVLARALRRGTVGAPRLIRDVTTQAAALPQDAVLAPQRSLSAASTIALTAVAMATVAAPAFVPSAPTSPTSPGDRVATPVKSGPGTAGVQPASAPTVADGPAYVVAPPPIKAVTSAVTPATTSTSAVSHRPPVASYTSTSATPATTTPPTPPADPPVPAYPKWTGQPVPAPPGSPIPDSNLTAPGLHFAPGGHSASLSGPAAIGTASNGGSGTYNGSLALPTSRCGSAMDATVQMTLDGVPTTLHILGELSSAWSDTKGSAWGFVAQVTSSGAKDYTGSGWVTGTIRQMADGSYEVTGTIWGPGSAAAPTGPAACAAGTTAADNGSTTSTSGAPKSTTTTTQKAAA